MRAPISVVIPTLNAERALVACLAALFEGLQAGLIRELIVVDGGSTDDTVKVAEEAGARVLHASASRGGQLRTGIAEAEGTWVMALHADTFLDDGWSAAAAAHFDTEKAGYFRLRFDQGGVAARIVAGWANLRSRLLGLPYGDQGLLIPRALYNAVGGYPDIPLMEDVALARALAGRLVPLDAEAITSADKYIQQGWARRGARNLWTLARYWMGGAPDRLAQEYRR